MDYYILLGLVFLVCFALIWLSINAFNWSERAFFSAIGIIFSLCLLILLLTPLEEICFKTKYISTTETVNETVTEIDGTEINCFSTEIKPDSFNGILLSLSSIFLMYFVFSVFDANRRRKDYGDDE